MSMEQTEHSPNLLVEPVARLIDEFGRLPGIGPKTASRLTFFLLRRDTARARALAQAIVDLKERVVLCSRCRNIAVEPLCPVCASTTRDQGTICVVEEPLDVLAIERTGAYRGLYHVLHGHLSPLDGIYREHLNIDTLLLRVRDEPVNEVIIATNPNTEGEATAFLLVKELAATGVRVTRLARGLPTGGDLEWADTETLGSALEGRHVV